VGVPAVALTLVLAACGGSGDSDGVASLTDTTGQSATDGDGAATTPVQDPEEARLEFAECMREHGVDMPDSGWSGEAGQSFDPDSEELPEAQEACEDLLPDIGELLTEEQQSAMQDAALAFSKCMREHGIDMPDPQFDETGGARVVMEGEDADDPAFQEAQAACEPIMEEALRESGLENGPVRSGGGGS
jgi:hypothetical protein